MSEQKGPTMSMTNEQARNAAIKAWLYMGLPEDGTREAARRIGQERESAEDREILARFLEQWAAALRAGE